MFVNDAVLARGDDPEALFAFFHTQRTGGSNFQRWLRQHFPDEVVYSSRTVDNYVHWQKISDFSTLGRFKVIGGFAEYRQRSLERPLVALATIRHPFYRIVSVYKMSQRHLTHFLHDVAVSESFEDFYRIGSQRKPEYFHNLITRRIGGGDKGNFAQAVANMKRDFGMVIPTNELYRGSELMVERFAWKIKPMEKKNPLPDAENYRAFDSSPVRAEIMANNQEDERLYNYVVRDGRDNVESGAQLPSGAGMSSTSGANKWKADEDFEEYRKAHPGADYSQFYTSRAVALVRSGKEHNSLGNNIVTGGITEFWETGARQSKRLMQLGSVQPSHRVVEYGCGSLRMAGHFLKLLKPGNFFGLDVVSDFYELGVANVGTELIEKARPQFAVISEESVAAATAFQPDFVFAHSVVIHVHPDILPKMLNNMARIASKPGAIVAFNALLHEPEVRYANLGWARPESYIIGHFRDFDLCKIGRSKPSNKGGYQVRGAMFVFRRTR